MPAEIIDCDTKKNLLGLIKILNKEHHG